MKQALPHRYVLIRTPKRVDWHYACEWCGARMSAGVPACPNSHGETRTEDARYAD